LKSGSPLCLKNATVAVMRSFAQKVRQLSEPSSFTRLRQADNEMKLAVTIMSV
jgi:hypothetical protein